jgi:hypothetical protein
MVARVLVQDPCQCDVGSGRRRLCWVCCVVHAADTTNANQISLTLGLMGLDELHLRVLATSSEDLTEKANAKKGTKPLRFSVLTSQ